MGIYNKTTNFYSDGIDRFIVLTVATERNENLLRFEESCKLNSIPYVILGLGDKWESGKAQDGVLLEPGGAQKIIYLRDEIKTWGDLENTIILFTDSYDVIFNDGPKEIVRKFREFKTPVLFSAEKTCWPNQDLADEYPEVDVEYKFLNSGGIIGYGDHILKMVDIEIEKSDDDQEFYTNYFLNLNNQIPTPIKTDDEEFQSEMLEMVRQNYGDDLILCNINPVVGEFGLLFGSHFKKIECVDTDYNIRLNNLSEIYDYTANNLESLEEKPDILFIYDINISDVELYEEYAKTYDEVIMIVDFSDNMFTTKNIGKLLPSYRVRNWSMRNENGWLSIKKDTETINKVIKLDYQQKLFQTLNLAIEEVEVEGGRIHNRVTNTTPSVLHGNGPQQTKERLNEIYEELNFDSSIHNGGNKILMNIFLDFEVSDIDQVFDQIRYLNYPKYNINLELYYGDESMTYKIDRFIEKFKSEYNLISKTFSTESKSKRRNTSIVESLKHDIDYVINMDCNYIFRNRESLKLLMKEGKNIISPMIVGEGTEWVNFWFRTDKDGYLLDSDEQEQIKKYEIHGNFSVGYITGIIMFNSNIIPNIIDLYDKNMELYDEGDFDINFSRNILRRGYQLWITNNNYFGGII